MPGECGGSPVILAPRGTRGGQSIASWLSKVGQAVWLVTARDLLFSSPVLGLQACSSMHPNPFFIVNFGNGTQASSLQGKHFTDWVTPTHVLSSKFVISCYSNNRKLIPWTTAREGPLALHNLSGELRSESLLKTRMFALTAEIVLPWAQPQYVSISTSPLCILQDSALQFCCVFP